MTTLLWVVAVLLIVVGIAGVVLPALPGVVFVFGGILLAAWIDDFTRIGVWTVVILGVLAAIAFVVDYVASTLAARRAGASKLGLLGAALGTVLGIFTGFIGLLFMPLVGAAIGEFIAQRDAIRAGQIGVATWIGLLVGTVLKLAIVFTMVGVFIGALLIA
ncbi:MAG: DUF456 domain-containing protein [Burkholderiaceae bacterium]|jgi:hypothetical protein|nr:DUF456 domain-containing protein [Burkholderiaceae bacterium]